MVNAPPSARVDAITTPNLVVQLMENSTQRALRLYTIYESTHRGYSILAQWVLKFSLENVVTFTGF